MDKAGNQTACYIQDLDQLDHFSVYNEEKECKVIKGLCQYKREPKWQGNRTFTDALLDVREEAKINYAAVIYPSDNMSQLHRTIRSLDAQELAPRKIIIIADTKYAKDIINWCRSNVQTKWTVVDRLTKEDCRDLALQRFKEFHFLAFFHAGYEVPPDKFQNLDVKINDEYLRFTFVDGDENGNGLILSQPIYKLHIMTAANLINFLKSRGLWIKFYNI